MTINDDEKLAEIIKLACPERTGYIASPVPIIHAGTNVDIYGGVSFCLLVFDRFVFREYNIMPLKGIPFILSPDLLHALCAAGHGDEIGKYFTDCQWPI